MIVASILYSRGTKFEYENIFWDLPTFTWCFNINVNFKRNFIILDKSFVWISQLFPMDKILVSILASFTIE